MAPSRADTVFDVDKDDDDARTLTSPSAPGQTPLFRAPRSYESDDEFDDAATLAKSPPVANSAAQEKEAVSGESLMADAEKHAEKSDNATVVFAIPLPELPFGMSEKKAASLPPFVLYALPPAPLKRPDEGEKESIVNKAHRTWQEKEREARKDDTTIKNKAIGFISRAMSYTKSSKIEFLGRTHAQMEELRVIYPASFPAHNIQEMFTKMIAAVKAAAMRNAVISTAVLPVVFVFDTLTFIPGPFEINAVFAAASWTGAARASSITNGIVGGKLPVNFESDDRLDSLVHRLHIIAREEAQYKVPMAIAEWPHAEPPMEGIELVHLLKAIVTNHLGLDAHEKYDPDNENCLRDIEENLRKGAKEWLSAIGTSL
ncbi:hypothetical protein BKA62DRAFT_708978 [Auriculariales sp. MPI-PUGE-AT-0066]|nr:hypothetical protein BKA62DRAFT_708978 [Auriculariales sp. MPI-PUGE-AT-0066]